MSRILVMALTPKAARAVRGDRVGDPTRRVVGTVREDVVGGNLDRGEQADGVERPGIGRATVHAAGLGRRHDQVDRTPLSVDALVPAVGAGHVRLFVEGGHLHDAGRHPTSRRAGRRPVFQGESRREHPVGVMVIVQGDAQLLQIVSALGAASRFPGRLHSGQQQRDQDGDDRNHDQQLDQSKSRTSSTLGEQQPHQQLLCKKRRNENTKITNGGHSWGP